MTTAATNGRGARGAGRGVLALGVAFACGTDSAHYGPPRDDLAMVAIASAWSQPAAGGLTLSLCEDKARSAVFSGPDGCQVDHVVRGGGLGLVHDVQVSGRGCGGCPHRALAYVQGTVSGGGLPGPASVRGQIFLGTTRSSDPYAFPYTLQVACEDPPRSCGITGTLAAEGHFAVTLVHGDPGAIGNPETAHALDRLGGAECP